jgi:hypothetical protein
MTIICHCAFRLLTPLRSSSSISSSCLFLLLLCCTAQVLVVGALQVSSTTNTNTAQQLLVNAKCRIQLSVGRVEGTAMPLDWASSGVRLVLPNLELQFRENESNDKERLLGPPSSQLMMKPLTEPSFVNKEGQKKVPVEEGAYCLYRQQQQEEEGPKMDFRFFLDFPEGAQRNDVTLPAERVFFTSTCWLDDDELAKMNVVRQETQHELKQLQDLFSKLEDDVGVLQQTVRFRSKMLMTERINLLRERRKDQDAILPASDEKDIIRGPPGILFAEEGYMTVKRYGGMFKMREEYHIVGKFTINEFIKIA